MNDKTLLIIGLGMIGGSLARAVRETFPDQKIYAADQNPDVLQSARSEAVVDEIGTLAELVPRADLCILAVPPLTMQGLLPEIASICRQDTVVSDVGSVKSHILGTVNEQSEAFIQNFVPGHPIAGSEQSGFAAADAHLFQERNVILTPQKTTSPAAVALVNALWRTAGAHVLGMTARRHDQVLAATSHLPHLLAYAIVDVLLGQEESDDIFRYAAGGFADFSRVASSDGEMWSDIFVANAKETEAVLDQYIAALQSLKGAIHRKAHAELKAVFDRARQTRNAFIQTHYNREKQQRVKQESQTFSVSAGGQITGSLRVPGDKSISHRAVILGALADEVTEVRGFLEGEDALKTVAAFREMGVTIVGPENGVMTIYGVGKKGLQSPRTALNMGNSGTAMRLMAGVLAAQNFSSELCGDESLNARPMGRISEPLKRMGAKIATSEDGTPPLRITGSALRGVHYDMPVASAQVKSCLLLAGLYAEGQTTVSEPAICRDHTERMLKGFGYPVTGGYPDSTVTIDNGHRLQATTIDVPADISSAAFFLVAASIAQGSELLLAHVGINPTRIGIITLLRQMGADIAFENEREVGGEPVADLRVRHSSLQGIVIPEEQVPLAIDEFPVLFIAAACAEGETILHGAEELRVKESDRIDVMACGLRSLGIEVEVFQDGLRIVGGVLQGGTVDSHGDHRIAMAFAVAGLRAGAPIQVLNAQNVATSFPGFAAMANAVGLAISEFPG